MLKLTQLINILHNHPASPSNVIVPFKVEVTLDIVTDVYGEKLRAYKAKY